LVYGVYQLLETNGTFACIIPKDREARFLEIAVHFQLLPVRTTYVQGTEDSKVKRCLIEFRFRKSVQNTNTVHKTGILVIEKSRHVYTNDYIQLTQDFYLKM
jgi:tRNA1Val (adenine37-N6)-methyltransferase